MTSPLFIASLRLILYTRYCCWWCACMHTGRPCPTHTRHSPYAGERANSLKKNYLKDFTPWEQKRRTNAKIPCQNKIKYRPNQSKMFSMDARFSCYFHYNIKCVVSVLSIREQRESAKRISCFFPISKKEKSYYQKQRIICDVNGKKEEAIRFQWNRNQKHTLALAMPFETVNTNRNWSMCFSGRAYFVSEQRRERAQFPRIRTWNYQQVQCHRRIFVFYPFFFVLCAILNNKIKSQAHLFMCPLK